MHKAFKRFVLLKFSFSKAMNYSYFNYIIIIVLTCFLFTIFKVRSKPTYNPFDDLFQIDLRQLNEDGCDTLSAECGYWNLAKIEEDFAVYYQIYQLGSKYVEAKGFVFWMDTFRMSINDYRPNMLDSFPISSTKVDRLEEIIHKFKFSVDTVLRDQVRIVSQNKIDTVVLGAHTYLERYQPRPIYVRRLDVFRPAPMSPIQKFKK
ncbi:MAG: hypothetical protein AAGI49_14035 [Bacteroidota bacterium]